MSYCEGGKREQAAREKEGMKRMKGERKEGRKLEDSVLRFLLLTRRSDSGDEPSRILSSVSLSPLNDSPFPHFLSALIDPKAG